MEYIVSSANTGIEVRVAKVQCQTDFFCVEADTGIDIVVRSTTAFAPQNREIAEVCLCSAAGCPRWELSRNGIEHEIQV